MLDQFPKKKHIFLWVRVGIGTDGGEKLVPYLYAVKIQILSILKFCNPAKVANLVPNEGCSKRFLTESVGYL